MAVDLGIGTINTTLSASDPAFFQSDEFKREVLKILRAEMEREAMETARRKTDMRGLSHREGT